MKWISIILLIALMYCVAGRDNHAHWRKQEPISVREANRFPALPGVESSGKEILIRGNIRQPTAVVVLSSEGSTLSASCNNDMKASSSLLVVETWERSPIQDNYNNSPPALLKREKMTQLKEPKLNDYPLLLFVKQDCRKD